VKGKMVFERLHSSAIYIGILNDPNSFTSLPFKKELR
jgi:hypothetical protein